MLMYAYFPLTATSIHIQDQDATDNCRMYTADQPAAAGAVTPARPTGADFQLSIG